MTHALQAAGLKWAWLVVRSFVGFDDVWATHVHSSARATCLAGPSDASVAGASVAGTNWLIGYSSGGLCWLDQLGRLGCHFANTWFLMQWLWRAIGRSRKQMQVRNFLFL